MLTQLTRVMLIALVACGSNAPATAPSPAPTLAHHVHATEPAPNCLDVNADVAKRESSPKRATWTVDVDGDGTPDPMFEGFCSMMGGNCTTYVYASNSGCPRYLGTVQVTQVSSGPDCAEPPQNHAPCTLSATRMMIHGELYEYFYVFDGTAYVEAGVGHKGAAPPRM